MSKMPPSLAISHHRRIERLHFPQDGDSNLFIKCGRKHFTDKYNNASPYASPFRDISSMDMEKGYQCKRLGKEEGGKSTILNRNPQISHIEIQNHRYQPTYYQTEQPQGCRQALEQQVYNFSINKAAKPSDYFSHHRGVDTSLLFRQEQEKRILDRENMQLQGQRLRIKTQIQERPVLSSKQDPFSRKRMRTQSCEPGVMKTCLKPPRFNPTFLSSINY